jgi:hypothetical protein
VIVLLCLISARITGMYQPMPGEPFKFLYTLLSWKLDSSWAMLSHLQQNQSPCLVISEFTWPFLHEWKHLHLTGERKKKSWSLEQLFPCKQLMSYKLTFWIRLTLLNNFFPPTISYSKSHIQERMYHFLGIRSSYLFSKVVYSFWGKVTLSGSKFYLLAPELTILRLLS